MVGCVCGLVYKSGKKQGVHFCAFVNAVLGDACNCMYMYIICMYVYMYVRQYNLL